VLDEVRRRKCKRLKRVFTTDDSNGKQTSHYNCFSMPHKLQTYTASADYKRRTMQRDDITWI